MRASECRTFHSFYMTACCTNTFSGVYTEPALEPNRHAGPTSAAGDRRVMSEFVSDFLSDESVRCYPIAARSRSGKQKMFLF